MKAVGITLIIMVWFTASIYIAIGAWLGGDAIEASLRDVQASKEGKAFTPRQGADGTVYDQPLTYRLYMKSQAYPKYSWLLSNSSFIPALAALAAGALGGLIGLIRQIARGKVKVTPAEAASAPLLSAFIGAMLYFLLLLLPTALFADSGPVRIQMLFAISLLGGVFTQVSYDFIEHKIKEIFKTKGATPV